MKKFSLLLLLLLFLSVQAKADLYNSPATLESISAQIPKMGSIKCKFRQEKHLQNITKPLISAGNFEFVENKGVYFHTLHPIESTVSYTNKNYRQINDIVNAVSTKKYSKLEKEFDFFFTGDKNSWSLGLQPKINSSAYNYISSITIDGTDYIHKISIQQTNVNNTILWFTK